MFALHRPFIILGAKLCTSTYLILRVKDKVDALDGFAVKQNFSHYVIPSNN